MQTLAVAGGKSLILLSKWHDEQDQEDAGQGEASKAANASQRGVEGPGEGGWLTHALSTTCGWMERDGEGWKPSWNLEACSSPCRGGTLGGERNVIRNRLA